MKNKYEVKFTDYDTKQPVTVSCVSYGFSGTQTTECMKLRRYNFVLATHGVAEYVVNGELRVKNLSTKETEII